MGAEIALLESSKSIVDHLVAQWEKWVQKLHFLRVQTVLRTIWWPNCKVGAEIALLDTSASIVDHLVAQQ